jgi:hypothetical protein
MIETSEPAARSVVTVAIIFEFALAVLALGLGWFLRRPPLAQIDWTLWGVLEGLAATVPLVAALLLMTHYPVGPLESLARVVHDLVVPLFGSASLAQLALVSALAGWGEELLFRGVVQAGLEQRFGLSWLALMVASLLFGLAHPMTLSYAVLAAVIGGYLGWLLMVTDNLLVPIIAHGAYDFVALIYLLRFADPSRGYPTTDEMSNGEA